ncbi:MAG: hypothetical protein IIB55_01415 [Planctomycetes bacterium]|nr:hypothetical protein [Planctomycetota bacterium]
MAKRRRIPSISVTRVVIALALGVTATVVVAWKFSREALYQRKQPNVTTWNAVKSGSSYWVYSVQRGTGWLQIDANATMSDLPDSGPLPADRTLRAPSWSKAATASSDDPDSYTDGQAHLSWRDVASGWPMLALRFRERTARKSGLAGNRNLINTTVTIQYGHPITDRFGLHNILPLRPVWPGFVINTFLFTIPAYLVLVIVGAGTAMLRRRRRRRKGLCTACGYDLAGLNGGRCPECGQALSSATIAAERDAAGL